MRLIIVILDHNGNDSKTIIGDKIVYTKSLERYTIKNRYSSTVNNWRQEIIHNIKEKDKENLIYQKEQVIHIPKKYCFYFKKRYK